MELLEVIKSRRTHRKFIKKEVPRNMLEKLVEYARFAPMAANIQGLKYAIIDDLELVKKVFPNTKWSGYHPEDAPTEDEQPAAYIAILGDKTIKKNGGFETDAGAAGTIISLVAEDMGLASCWLGSVNRKEVSRLINLPDTFDLLYVIAVGYSDQSAKSIDAQGDIKYFTDDDGVLNVPKRTLNEILI